MKNQTTTTASNGNKPHIDSPAIERADTDLYIRHEFAEMERGIETARNAIGGYRFLFSMAKGMDKDSDHTFFIDEANAEQGGLEDLWQDAETARDLMLENSLSVIREKAYQQAAKSNGFQIPPERDSHKYNGETIVEPVLIEDYNEGNKPDLWIEKGIYAVDRGYEILHGLERELNYLRATLRTQDYAGIATLCERLLRIGIKDLDSANGICCSISSRLYDYAKEKAGITGEEE